MNQNEMNCLIENGNDYSLFKNIIVEKEINKLKEEANKVMEGYEQCKN